MRFARLSRFLRYACVGVVNTLIHTCVFLSLVYETGLDQGPANLAAFLVAVTFSYFANALWTFKAPVSTLRYGLFVSFMALMAWAIGSLAKALAWPPLLTLFVFSAISLGLGYAYARSVAFKGGRP